MRYSTAKLFHSHSWNVFVSTELYFLRIALTSTQHLQISWKALEYGDILFAKSDIPCFNQVDTVSEVCTFNTKLPDMTFSKEESGRIDNDQPADTFTPYLS
ncbi:hypothetical protein BDV34DRAFT_192707 [Aspergillus parasiticus]|uniref:Uncharacterized protein n=1 Tax=Aspergillus parasiticus TaxID=5067 RepID=A0A5N6DPH5_ASPPA|nr:hypothetical protein BDV34DRAFT_192707 [Aspergillus parasiticus]